MTTYGPFYPSAVSQVSGGAAWINPDNVKQADGNPTTATISGEGETNLLKLTSFNATIPSNTVLKHVRFVQTPSLSGAFNPSAHQVLGTAGGPYDLSVRGDTYALDDDEDGFPTPTELTSAAFGMQLSIYAQNGGTVSLDAIALYVDAD